MRVAILVAALAACVAEAAAPAVSAGGYFSLTLHADGTVRAWGDDRSGQLGIGRRLAALEPVQVALAGTASLSAGDGYTLVSRSDGSVWGWGYNGYDQLAAGRSAPWSVPARLEGLADVSIVAARSYSAAAVTRDGRVWTWGGNNNGSLGDGTTRNRATPAPIAGLSGIVGIAVAATHMVALRNDGLVFAWGTNDRGQLGDGTREHRASPIPVPGLTGVRQVSAYGSFTFALKDDGSVWAWGSNGSGQLGDGTTVDRLVPTRVPGLPFITQVSAAGAMALAADGTVWDWGYQPIGGRPGGLPGQVANLTDVVKVSGGGAHVLVLKRDGTVWGWGYNTVGQLADGTRQHRGVPVQARISDVEDLSAGYGHNIARRRDGSLWAWGENGNGALGDASALERTAPVAVPDLAGVIAISAGDAHAAAVRSDGTVWTWGENDQGRLGIGLQATSQSAPVRVEELSGVTDVAAGGVHTLALRSDGTVWAWGFDYQGQLGNGVTHASNGRPVQALDLAGMRAVSAGYLHSVALGADGRVWTWGDNSRGQLGDNTPSHRSRPEAINGIAGVTAISAGSSHTVALTADGSVWAWGNNELGQLGDGTRNSRSAPARVVGVPTAIAISAGGGGTLALARDGTLWTWGQNAGESTEGDPLRPAPVAEISGVASASASRAAYYNHAVARKGEGTVWSWGDSDRGQVGDGTYAGRRRPVLVVREGGAGNVGSNDWYLDLDPAIAKAIPPEKVPAFGVVARGSDTGVTADLRFRSQDVGTTAATFVFALAPASRVQGRLLKHADPRFAWKARDAHGKSSHVQCALAQLNAQGQLVAVSAASLQAYVSGVLSAQGQSVNVLDNVPPANVAGATFYVGYGASANAMLVDGKTRSVVSVPGTLNCRPQAPQTGWWYNAAEGGRGFSIEARGNRLFFAAFHYEADGRATWNFAGGPTSLDGSLFTADFLAASGGQSLTGPYRLPGLANAGAVTFAFSDATHGTMIWPGGTTAIERQAFIPGGLTAPVQPGLPQSGWWWNPAESGRGFFLEWQGGYVDIAGYMYDAQGRPTWYISALPTPDPLRISGNWWTFANGQAMGQAYRPATRTSDNAGALDIQFSSSTTATMTLPDGRRIPLVRQAF